MTNYSVGWLTLEVAAILRGQAAKIGVSQARLGEVAGVSQSQMSKILRGQRDITVDQLDWLCDELELTPSEVIAGAEESTSARNTDDPASPWNRGVETRDRAPFPQPIRRSARQELPTVSEERERRRSEMLEPEDIAARDEDGR